MGSADPDQGDAVVPRRGVGAGKIRYVGLSNVTGSQLQLAVSTARARGEVPVTLQAQYNLAIRQTELELTGKYDRDQPCSADTLAGQGHPLCDYPSSNYEHDDVTWSAVDAIRQVAKEVDATPAQIALSWVINRPGVVAAVVGARDVAQLHTSLAGADLHLDADAAERLTEASTPSVAACPYGPFGAAQRDRVANGPEALGKLIANVAAGES